MAQTDKQGKASTTAIVSSSHLAESAVGWQLSELEFAMTIAYNAYSRWMAHCMTSTGYKDFNSMDILILHNINHRSKEKRLADIAFMLNIEDTHAVNYAVKKLLKSELVVGQKTGKEIFYCTTDKGKQVCQKYGDVRETCLLETATAAGWHFDEVSHVAKVIRTLSGVYDQASRAAASL